MSKVKEKDTGEKKSPTAGSVIGTVLRSVTLVLGFIFKIIFKACTVFGLWIPIIYAVFGLALYLFLDFNPFLFDTLGTLYLCGFIACVIGACFIAIRNLIIKPAKSIYEGYRHPLWEKQSATDTERKEEISRWERYKQDKREEKLSPPEIIDFERDNGSPEYGDLLAPLSDFDAVSAETKRKKLKHDWLPQTDSSGTAKPKVVAVPSVEKPTVYFSSLEPDVLVHEYGDRFELYKVSGNRTTPIGVEYK